MASNAFAEPGADAVGCYLGTWTSGKYTLVCGIAETGDIARRLTRDDGAETAVWEYGMCLYDEELEAMVCAGCTRYRESIDFESKQTVQTDWSFDDLSPTSFALSDDIHTLITSDVPGIDGELTFLRHEDAADCSGSGEAQ